MTLHPPAANPAPADASAGGLLVRPAAAGDLDALAAIEAAAFASDRLTRRRLRALAAAPSARLIVAERQGRAVGYALLLLRRGSRVARLYSIAVDPAEAGRGTGRRLTAAAEAAAHGAGARRLRLEVRADNHRAAALYRALGYRPLGERPHYYEDGMTALRYEKALAGSGA